MNELVKSISIENMLRQRDAAIERLTEAKRLIDEADAIATSAGLGTVSGHIGDRYGRGGGGAPIGAPDFVASITKRVDAHGWQHLMKESGILTLMDAKAREEWHKGVYEYTTPALTLENVNSTFGMLYEGRGELFERGLINCFRGLSWDYKTNQPFKLGKRIIMKSLFQAQISSYMQSVNYHAADRLDDLVRVFSVLDGKPEPDYRNGVNSRLTEAARKRERFADLEYFEIVWFKNGNGHLTFKRLDLVEQVNKVIAKNYPNALASELRK